MLGRIAKTLAVVALGGCSTPLALGTLAPVSDVMVGDSITNQRPACMGRVALGINSGTSKQVLARLGEVEGYRPRTATVLVGINDVSKGVQPADTIGNVQDIVTRLGRTGAKVRLVSVLPVAPTYQNPRLSAADMNAKAAAINSLFATIKGASRVSVVLPAGSYQADGIHLNERGYEAMRNQLGDAC